MKLPTIKRILREDVKEAPGWVNGLIDPLNSFMETVYQALNRNLTLNENLASFTVDLTYRTDSAYPGSQADVKFQNTLKSQPVGVIVLQAFDRDTYVPAAGPVYVPWVYSGTQVVISTITGLDASKTYTIRLLIY